VRSKTFTRSVKARESLHCMWTEWNWPASRRPSYVAHLLVTHVSIITWLAAARLDSRCQSVCVLWTLPLVLVSGTGYQFISCVLNAPLLIFDLLFQSATRSVRITWWTSAARSLAHWYPPSTAAMWTYPTSARCVWLRRNGHVSISRRHSQNSSPTSGSPRELSAPASAVASTSASAFRSVREPVPITSYGFVECYSMDI